MALTYQELLTQALSELADREQRSIPLGFAEQLMELCLLIISVGHQPLRSTTEIIFPSSVPVNLFDFLPLIDIHVNTNLPDIIRPIAVRNDEGKSFNVSSEDVLMYFTNSLDDTDSEQEEYYRIYDNLFGVRPGPVEDTLVELVYIPYIQVPALTALFALDDSYIPHMVQLLKCFLFLRQGQTVLADGEWKQYVDRR